MLLASVSFSITAQTDEHAEAESATAAGSIELGESLPSPPPFGDQQQGSGQHYGADQSADLDDTALAWMIYSNRSAARRPITRSRGGASIPHVSQSTDFPSPSAGFVRIHLQISIVSPSA